MFMKEKTTYLSILHSIEKYSGDFMNPDEYSGEHIGFMVERTKNTNPFPVKSLTII